MRVCVIGTGHVGLITCVTLAEIGHEVIGTDSDAEKIQLLSRGTTPFFETGLQELLISGLEAGRLRFTIDPGEAVADAEVIFICVGTPARLNGEANLVAVEQAARSVARCATKRAVIVEKSTVPAGTSQRMRELFMRDRRTRSLHLEIVSNPEFLREGAAVKDSLEPDRILIGAESEWAFQMMRELYTPLTNAGARLIETNIATAELAKHSCNAFLAMKISFTNAIARLCEEVEADVVSIADVMGSDSRIGRAFLNAGLGYGGYCFPKDVAAFEVLASKCGYDFALLREVKRINDEAVEWAAKKVEAAVWNLEGKRIALLGLSFKPGTDDVRFSPALALAQRLLDGGATVVGYDPQAMPNAKSEIPELELAPDAYAATTGADCTVICTEWDEFAALDLEVLREVMAYPAIVDGRNLLDPETVAAHGFSYSPVGRPAA